MTCEYYLYFAVKIENLNEFFKKLIKEQLIDFVRIDDKELAFDDALTRLKNGFMKLDLGWHVWIRLTDQNKCRLTVHIVGTEKGIPERTLRIIRVANNMLELGHVEAVHESPAEPIYKGPWSLEIFEKKIRPQIENEKEKGDGL